MYDSETSMVIETYRDHYSKCHLIFHITHKRRPIGELDMWLYIRNILILCTLNHFRNFLNIKVDPMHCLSFQICPVYCSVAKPYPTLVTPWAIPPGSSVHVILQARILEWVAIPFSRGSSMKQLSVIIFCSIELFLGFCGNIIELLLLTKGS